MNISSRCEYACRAVYELARGYRSGEPTTATHIAEQRGIPEKYLVHILLQLKRSGIVRSVRGAQGGYLLDRQPGEITLRDVVIAVDGPVFEPLSGGGDELPELTFAWKEVADGIEEVLAKTTFQSLLDRASPSGMYYI
jgi:Rrf2 family protein